MMGPIVYHPTRIAVFFSLTLGMSFRFRGEQHIPKEGPVLLVANHQSFLDPLLIALAANRPVMFLARRTLWKNRFFGKFIDYCGAMPIEQSFGREGLQIGIDIIKSGRALTIFPEGERTTTGKMLPLKPGIALLAKKINCPIVPVGLAGAFEVWPRWKKLPRPVPLFLPAENRGMAVCFGPAIAASHLHKATRDEITTQLHDRIAIAQSEAESLRRH